MISYYQALQARKDAEGEEGFTLIELLIVIVVLGILAAVVVFALGSVTGNAKAAACSADAKTVETAVGAYDANPNSSSAVIGLEVVPAVPASSVTANDVTVGDPGSYGTATNAAELVSGQFVNVWPQGNFTLASNNGYVLSLANEDQACSSTAVVATCGTAGPTNPNKGLGALAGQVIVYTSGQLTIADEGLVPTTPTVAQQYTTGVIYDTESSTNGCNFL